MKKNKIHSLSIFPLTWLFIFILFLVLRMGEIHELAPYVEWIFIFITPLVALIIRGDRQLSIQMFVIDIYFGAVWGFAIINKLAHKNHKALILFGAIAFLSTAIILFKEVVNYFRSINYTSVIKSYWSIAIPTLIFILLSYETIFEIPWHDAEYYYCWEIKKISYWFDYTWYDISDYTLAGHFSIGYALIALLAELIYPQNAVVLHIFNILLAVLSGISLYKILNYVYPNKGKYIKTVCVSIYLLSPWILGIIGYINIDTPSIYIFIMLVSCYLYKRKLWMTVLAFLFVYTKEPSIIYFAFFCLGIVCSELYINRKKGTEYSQQKNVVVTFLCVIKEHVPEILIGISWFTCYLLRFDSMWGGAGGSSNDSDAKIHCFGFTIENLLMKAKGVLVLNFNWIFALIITVTFVLFIVKTISKKCFIKKDDNRLIYTNILYFTLLGFIVFNLFYLDFEHPRYNAIGAVLVILIGLDIILQIKERITTNIIVTCICVVITIQSMITIDPLTKLVYGSLTDYGESKIVKDIHFVYNREYSYYYGAIEKILEECKYDGSQDVSMFNVFPPYGPLCDYWWDLKKHRMTPTENKNTVMINFVFDKEGYNVFNSKHSRIVIYPYSAQLTGEFGEATYKTISLKYQQEDAY